MASSTPILGYYGPSKPLCFSVDASSNGLGAVLLQDEKPLAYASRALTPTQQRYAQVEKEPLAIVYGVQKFHQYSEFQQATAADPTLQALSTVVRSGWPCHKQELPLTVCEYWSCGDEISEIDGLLFKAQKYIVPQSKRKEMLELIHESHQGILKCKQRARDILFWPGMSYQIEEKVSQCSLCVRFQKAQPREPMIIKDLPDRMWSKVGTDLFEYNGIYYILCVDYYSKWIELAKLDNLTSDNVICHLKSQFSRYGKPDELISDNGPQYPSSAFSDFSKSYGFLHATSSPHFPQANGEAERAV
ncbi:uncharacterized protein K02A2.6-like [Stylophora pistillata]|uniref:uncharacterized protein K02A2.6-like n=1 Tax=Stylophora pistillata TaxID=50429 RepID=UPI000C056999|nr:uncharacterized protein K02A2.6-like [Stylophora pistillata]